MAKIIPVDVTESSIDIFRDLSLATRQTKPGPPERIDGMTVGIVTNTPSPAKLAHCPYNREKLWNCN